MPPVLKEILIRAPIALVLAWGLVTGYMTLNQNSLIYFPATDKPSPHVFGQQDVEIISVKTSDGLNLQGWYKSSGQKNAPVMLVFHGNAGHIGYRTHFFNSYLHRGIDVLLAEYRGYGGNPGKPGEQGFYSDAQAYISYLIQEMKYDPKSVVLYGESLGTGIVVEMATRHAVGAIVLEAPYDTLVRLASTHHPYIPFLTYLMRDQYLSVYKIEDISVPKLFLMAGRDVVIPNKHTQALYDAAIPPKKLHIFPEAHHNNFYDYGADEVVYDYLKEINII